MDERTPYDVPRTPYRADPPTPAQLASLLAALALTSPAMLGGVPMLPVTVTDERRRQQQEIAQQSESTVGIHHEAQEAEGALALSQRRLAAATREVEGTHARTVSEEDVVRAAHRVAAGQTSGHQGQRFRTALNRVALDSADYFMLAHDEGQAEQDRPEGDEPLDEEAWLASFE